MKILFFCLLFTWNSFSIIVQSPQGTDVHINGNLIASCDGIVDIFTPPSVNRISEYSSFANQKTSQHPDTQYWFHFSGPQLHNDDSCPNGATAITNFAHSFYNSKLLLYGGRASTGSIPFYGGKNSFFEYKLSTGQWELYGGSMIDVNAFPQFVSGGENQFLFGNYPPGLSDARSVIFGNYMYLIGGFKSNGYWNDVWVVEFINYFWRYASGTNVKNTPANFAQGNEEIGGLDGHMAGNINDNYIVTFGGRMVFSGSTGLSNVVMVYDTINDKWSYVLGSQFANDGPLFEKGFDHLYHSGNMIGGRSNFAYWIIADEIFIFGGNGVDINDNVGYMSDLWSFSFILDQWRYMHGEKRADINMEIDEQFTYDGNSYPGGLQGMSFAQLDMDKFVIFGGKDPDLSRRDEVWFFSLEKNSWAFMKGSLISNALPIFPNDLNDRECHQNTKISSLEGSGMFVDNGKIYVFGGNRGFKYCDVWELSTTTIPCTTLMSKSDPGETLFFYVHSDISLETRMYKVFIKIHVNVVTTNTITLHLQKNNLHLYTNVRELFGTNEGTWYSYQVETIVDLSNGDMLKVIVFGEPNDQLFYSIDYENMMTLIKLE